MTEAGVRPEIRRAATPADYAALASLAREYVASLPFPLTFQDFERELAEIDREYGPPHGCAFLALAAGEAVGGVGVRRFDDDACEMKRMYVRPAARGFGLGRALAVAAVEGGRELGYAVMRLDTIDTMTAALAIYRSIGFTDIPPYRHNPLPGATYLEMRLR